jgi:hypothetical protein
MKSINLKSHSIVDRDALQVVLSICKKTRIGYDRDGIRRIFSIHSNMSLSSIIDLLQEVFIKTQYISAENVNKVSGAAPELPEIAAVRSIEPLQRCSICTLFPPCKHTTVEDLARRGMKRRGELPRHKNGMICPEFARYGRCSIFNHHGRCALDHPKNIHKVVTPPVRCPVCTIVWPCGHCSFTSDRIRLLGLVNEIRGRIHILKQIVAPNPPLSLIRHMVR